jgi:GDPmannose 4,6-dehydratase
MLQQDEDEIDDYVIGTGRAQTVRRCAEIAFDELGLDYEDYVEIDDRFYRPAEVDVLQADSSRAERELSWSATTSFETLIRDMVRTDLQRVRQGNEFWVNTDVGLRLQSSTSGEHAD